MITTYDERWRNVHGYDVMAAVLGVGGGGWMEFGSKSKETDGPPPLPQTSDRRKSDVESDSRQTSTVDSKTPRKVADRRGSFTSTREQHPATTLEQKRSQKKQGSCERGLRAITFVLKATQNIQHVRRGPVAKSDGSQIFSTSSTFIDNIDCNQTYNSFTFIFKIKKRSP